MLSLLRSGAALLCFFLFLASFPLFLLSQIFPGEEVIPVWELMTVECGVLFAFASGFVLITWRGDRMLQSIRLRITGGFLLAFPIGICALPLVREPGNFSPLAILLLLLLSFSILLFSAFVFPAWLRYTNKTVNEPTAR